MKLTLPLKSEKGSSVGELSVELDDLNMPLGGEGNTSPSPSSAPPSSQSSSNHVNALTSRSSDQGAGTVGGVANQLDLMSLDTPTTSRRGQEGGGHTSSAGSSRQPSPRVSPVPPTASSSMTAVGVAAVGGAIGGSSPVPPTNSQASVRSRVASSTRTGTSTPPPTQQPPRPPVPQQQPRPPAPQQTTATSRPQQPAILVRPQQQQASIVG